MTSFVFWNLNQCKKANLIAELAHQYDVDILILAECVIAPSVLLTELNKKTQQLYHYSPSSQAEHTCYFWNMFDQVLLRPDLLECFDNKNLKIIDMINGLSLLSMNGRPSRAVASDHLPIYFELYL